MGFVLTTTMGGMIRFAGVPADDAKYVFGSIEANRLFSCVPNRTTSTRFTVYYQAGLVSIDASAVATGTVAINNKYAYKNGVPFGAQFSALAGDGTVNLYLGAANSGLNASTPLTNSIVIDVLAACFWNGNLEDAQVLALHNAITTLP
jgi:ABC-type Fe2+-enterobactin transport system substrate-binding protein